MKDYWCLKIISTVSSFSCKFAITIKSSEDRKPPAFFRLPHQLHIQFQENRERKLSRIRECFIVLFAAILLWFYWQERLRLKLLILYLPNCFQNVKCGLWFCRESHVESAMRAMCFDSSMHCLETGYCPIQLNLHFCLICFELFWLLGPWSSNIAIKLKTDDWFQWFYVDLDNASRLQFARPHILVLIFNAF